MLTKQDLDRWYDEGQKPLSSEKKQALNDLKVSFNSLNKNIKRIGFIQKIPYPVQWKEKGVDRWIEIITGKQFSPVNKEWVDLRIKI